jgi:hypothetical protein
MDDTEIRYRNRGAVRTRLNSAVIAGIALACMIVAFAALATIVQSELRRPEARRLRLERRRQVARLAPDACGFSWLQISTIVRA